MPLKKCNLISPYSHNRVTCKLTKLTMRLQRNDTISRIKIQLLLFTEEKGKRKKEKKEKGVSTLN